MVKSVEWYNCRIKKIYLLISFITILLSLVPCQAAATTEMYEFDANTPFDYRDIYVGTKLKVIVSSDSNGYWNGGGVFLEGANQDLGRFLPGEINDLTNDYSHARTEKAGSNAQVLATSFTLPFDANLGFDYYGSSDAVAGDWFILDYQATSPGTCTINVYDFEIDYWFPVDYIDIHQIPPDIYQEPNDIVNFRDYSLLTYHWGRADCNEPNYCGHADLNMDGLVDPNDMKYIMDHWLETLQ